MQAQHDLSVVYVESLFADYQRDPSSVPDEWHAYFAAMQESEAIHQQGHGGAGRNGGNGEGATRAGGGNGRGAATPAGAPTAPPARGRHAKADARSLTLAPDSDEATDLSLLQHHVDTLVRNYRARGHMIARVDPLGKNHADIIDLEPASVGIAEADLDRAISTGEVGGPDAMTVRQIIAKMHNTYCRSIGVQFMHIDSYTVRRWLTDRMEGGENRIALSVQEQTEVLRHLIEAVQFEEFIQKKYVGAKSFSLEGAETLIPLLDLAIEKAAEKGVEHVVLAMAHRGRLNVLANIMGKKPEAIFREFEDKAKGHGGSGDVKYHMGYESDITFDSGRKVHLSLCHNPSHLEYINCVAMGRLRAKQDEKGDSDRSRGMVLMIHGDAAFIGEGVTQETLNLSELPPYKVGGALHVVVNNQIGFTTAPEEARSCQYCTDVAKMLQAPIFHVNGEDPEAVMQVVTLAIEFRHRFQRDVFIDMYCYRRRGHNEGDEPAFTQPKLYAAIGKRKKVYESYLERLAPLGNVTRDQAKELARRHNERLEESLKVAKSDVELPALNTKLGAWSRYLGGSQADVPEIVTSVEAPRLSQLLETLARVPEGFKPNPKISKILEGRMEMAQGKKPLDWAAGEALGMASLATEGYRVRLTGQDAQRGTFSHRHAVLHDADDDGTYCALKHLAPDQAPVEICNSPLSEAGVLGFEYGYSLDWPAGLIMWEAQFGDFFNCAQVIVDQFITSAEDKWNLLSGLVMLLPHGFEGAGPEHSSGRIERWLLLGAKDNIQLVVPSTPAQVFHMLRRQVLSPLRKPLIVMTPKSLLRNPDVVSTMDELSTGRFQRVIADPRFAGGKKKVERVLVCSGKIYYELLKKREDLKRDDVAILRMEQIYPLPLKELEEALAVYPDNTKVYWVQEEPKNMGAWPFMRANLGFILFSRLPFLGVHRAESASPATGSPGVHKKEQEQLLNAAFGAV